MRLNDEKVDLSVPFLTVTGTMGSTTLTEVLKSIAKAPPEKLPPISKVIACVDTEHSSKKLKETFKST